jgi:Bacterial Ig-like domain (group 2)/Secretion system C-terminal sorting domain
MKNKLLTISIILCFIANQTMMSQYCNNFKASYDGVRLKLSGLNNSGKKKVSITHNGGATYTDITSKLTPGQDVVIITPLEPVESVLMEGSDLAGSAGSVCSKSIAVIPTNTKSSTPIISILAYQGFNSTNAQRTSLQLTASVLPMSLSDRSVTWSVASGTGKANVSATGLVTGVSNGTVTVTAKSNLNPTISKSILITINGTSVDEVSSSVTVRPNPVVDVLHISSPELLQRISVFNIEGQLVIDKPNLNSGELDVNFSSLPSGVYIVKFERHDGVGVQKVIKN